MKSKTASDSMRRSQPGVGAALLCVLFLVETAVAHRSVPHPAPATRWSVLAIMGAGAVVAGIVRRLRARRAGQAARR